jgi:hypothetical protein
LDRPRENDRVTAAFGASDWLTLTASERSRHLIPQHDNSTAADFFEW